METPNPSETTAGEPPFEDPGKECMLALQAGDEAAFERLIGLYSERAYALFVRFLGRHEGCEDLVQDLFLRMWKARDRYEPSARFTTWMYRIAFNLAANDGERRRLRRSQSLSTEVVPGKTLGGGLIDESIHEPSLGLEREDTVHQVREAIASLPDTQRMALILARYEEQPYQDIGESLGISAKAVKSLIHRARETLRQRLAHMITGDLK
ncbi:MAG: RNA polymerase sigma factor [Planctomycetes bacterium]|nr:RNA polymerase sigma factor [Planctomycetota bacterium]